MNFKLCFMFHNIFVILVFAVAVVENGSSAAPKKVLKEDFYIDDDTEGSGAGHSNTDGKYDLESSGSGFGPDDEDADHDTPTFTAPKKPETIPKRKNIVDTADLDTDEESLPSSTTKQQPPQLPITYPTVPDVPKWFEKERVETKPTVISSTTSDSTSTEENTHNGNDIYINDKDRTISFFAQPGILAAVIGGAVVGLLCAILVVMFIVYRMRKKDEGSYVLEEMKRSPASNPYMKTNHREFYA